MNLWDAVAESVFMISQMWKSFASTVLSGNAIGFAMAIAFWITAFTAVGMVGWYLIWRIKTRRKRRVVRLVAEFKAALKGKMMDEAERGRAVQLIAQDRITDALEEAYFLGEITLEEKDALYKKIADSCKWQDLLRFSQYSKKEQIKEKIDPKSPRYAYRKVTLPDLTAAVKKVSKRFSGRLLKRNKTA